MVIRGKGWVYEKLQGRCFAPVIMDAKGSFNWHFLSRLIAFMRRDKVDLLQSHSLGSSVYCSLAGMSSILDIILVHF